MKKTSVILTILASIFIFFSCKDEMKKEKEKIKIEFIDPSKTFKNIVTILKYQEDVRLQDFVKWDRDGYKLEGFTKDKDKSIIEYQLNKNYRFTEDMVLYALWSKIENNNKNEGSDNSDNNTNDNNNSNNTDNKDKNDGNKPDSITPPSGQYSVKFYKNDGTDQVWKEEFHNPGEKFTLPDPENDLKRDNYQIRGWIPDNPESIDMSPIGLEVTMPSHNVKYYISWRIIDISKTGGPFKEYANKEVFVYGTNIPSYFNQSSKWENDIDDPQNEGPKTTKWTPECGWFDSYQGPYNLCWAGSASNMIHWWLLVNKDNIEKYNRIRQSKGQPTVDISKFNYSGAESDNLFDLFSLKTFTNKGGVPGIAFNWFFKGKDTEPADRFQDTAEDGGYFKDVIHKDDNIYESNNNVHKWDFSLFIGKALKEKKAITVSATILGGQHQETIWGAKFDEQGYVIGLYSTDSSTKTYLKDNSQCGLNYWPVYYRDNGEVYWLNDNFSIHGLASLSSCEKEWKRYFSEH